MKDIAGFVGRTPTQAGHVVCGFSNLPRARAPPARRKVRFSMVKIRPAAKDAVPGLPPLRTVTTEVHYSGTAPDDLGITFDNPIFVAGGTAWVLCLDGRSKLPQTVADIRNACQSLRQFLDDAQEHDPEEALAAITAGPSSQTSYRAKVKHRLTQVRQALESLWRAMRFLPGAIAPPDMPQDVASIDQALQATDHIARWCDENQKRSKQTGKAKPPAAPTPASKTAPAIVPVVPAVDDSAWILISKLQPSRIESVKKRKRYIEKHPEIKSRRPLTRKGTPHPRQLEVYSPDWVRHWDKVDKQTFNNLDSAIHAPITPDELAGEKDMAETFVDGATKRYSKLYQGKKSRP